MKRVTILSSAVVLLALTTGWPQSTDFALELQQKLARYYELHQPAKIHVTLNQDKYAPGDTAFYKIHFFRADDFHPIPGRQILTVALLDNTGSIVHRAKVLLTDGTGMNQIAIPSDAVAGRYTLVSYSDVMTGYDPSLFFQRPLWVAGPKAMEAVSVNDLRLFPEGGHLIAGITNKIVVRGDPGISGIVTAGEKQVATFTTDSHGFGLFFLTPAQSTRYVATTGTTETALPPVEDDGIGLLVHSPGNRSPIRVTAQIPAKSEWRTEKLFLVMTQHEIVYYAAEFTFSDKSYFNFALPQDMIAEGIVRITVMTQNGEPLVERLIYASGSGQPEAHIDLGKTSYDVREEVPLTLSISDASGKGIQSSLAVSVYRREDMKGLESGNIVDNALLFGDLPGSLTNDADLFPADSSVSTAVDLFLVTQSWQRFAWRDVWSGKERKIPFRSYLHLEGRAFRSNGQPLPDSTVITFFLQRSVMTYLVEVGPTGEFDFSLLMDFNGSEEIFYKVQGDGKVLHDVGIKLHEDFQFPHRPASRKILAEDDPFFSFSTKRKQIDQSYAYHTVNRVDKKPPSLNALIEEEVSGADIVINFADYYLFPTMSETLREIVPILQHRRQKSMDVVRLFFDDRNRFAEGEPLFIIDGVITDNTTYFLSLKPSEVVSVKIVFSLEKLESFGSIGENGIVMVETKIPGNASRVPRSPNTFSAVGLQPASPSHATRNVFRQERIPDLRTNLYWSPYVRTDSSGRAVIKIPASDVTGTFTVRLEGFTSDRRAVYAEKDFTVLFTE